MKNLTSCIIVLGIIIIPSIVKAENFQTKVAEIATQEWKDFAVGTQYKNGIIVRNKKDVTQLEKNPLEYEKCQIVNKYWGSVSQKDTCLWKSQITEWDNSPWSAAFVSYIFGKVGAGNRFKYSPSHSTYIRDSVKNKSTPNYPFKSYEISKAKPEVGDLICAPRKPNIPMSYEDINKKNSFNSHCDIVVNVNANNIEAIGGNVGDSVAKTIIPLDSKGYLFVEDRLWRPWFTIIKNNL